MADQVLPYIYTHLVSASCTVYLMFNAFKNGLYFQPDASYTFGVLLPATSIFMATLGIFGLLEVGDTILDPFGNDPEDFAVLHFVEWTIVSSLEAVTVPKRTSIVEKRSANGPTRGVNRYAFASEKEVRAAMLLSFLVMRWRRRKRKEQEQAAARRQMNASKREADDAEVVRLLENEVKKQERFRRSLKNGSPSPQDQRQPVGWQERRHDEVMLEGNRTRTSSCRSPSMASTTPGQSFSNGGRGGGRRRQREGSSKSRSRDVDAPASALPEYEHPGRILQSAQQL